MRKIAATLLLFLAIGARAASDEVQIHIDANLRKRVIAGHGRRLVGGFHPNWIEVRRGDRVTIELHSEEGTHALAIPEFKVQSPPVAAGETVTFSFVADRSGEFRMECAAECEGLHRAMLGTLVVGE